MTVNQQLFKHGSIHTVGLVKVGGLLLLLLLLVDLLLQGLDINLRGWEGEEER